MNEITNSANKMKQDVGLDYNKKSMKYMQATFT